MSKAAELSEGIRACLERIRPANGFSTDVKGIYGFGETKPDKAPTPCLLVRIAEDEMGEMVGTTASRTATYEIQGVLSRSASLQDLQRLHHDILVALGTGKLPHIRPLKPGWPFEESAEFDADQDGSTARTVTSTVTLRYIEKY